MPVGAFLLIIKARPSMGVKDAASPPSGLHIWSPEKTGVGITSVLPTIRTDFLLEAANAMPGI